MPRNPLPSKIPTSEDLFHATNTPHTLSFTLNQTGWFLTNNPEKDPEKQKILVEHAKDLVQMAREEDSGWEELKHKFDFQQKTHTSFSMPGVGVGRYEGYESDLRTTGQMQVEEMY